MLEFNWNIELRELKDWINYFVIYKNSLNKGIKLFLQYRIFIQNFTADDHLYQSPVIARLITCTFDKPDEQRRGASTVNSLYELELM